MYTIDMIYKIAGGVGLILLGIQMTGYLPSIIDARIIGVVLGIAGIALLAGV